MTARNRLLAKRARHDTRAWQVKRRERTRQLIELGGLVAKSGIVELTEDDRAAILGLLIEAAAILRSGRRDEALTLWRRRGKRSFAFDSNGREVGQDYGRSNRSSIRRTGSLPTRAVGRMKACAVSFLRLCRIA